MQLSPISHCIGCRPEFLLAIATTQVVPFRLCPSLKISTTYERCGFPTHHSPHSFPAARSHFRSSRFFLALLSEPHSPRGGTIFARRSAAAESIDAIGCAIVPSERSERIPIHSSLLTITPLALPEGRWRARIGDCSSLRTQSEEKFRCRQRRPPATSRQKSEDGCANIRKSVAAR